MDEKQRRPLDEFINNGYAEKYGREFYRQTVREQIGITIAERIKNTIATDFKFFTVKMTYPDWLEWSGLYPDVFLEQKTGQLASGFYFVAEKIRMRDECRAHKGFYTLNRQWVNVEFI